MSEPSPEGAPQTYYDMWARGLDTMIEAGAAPDVIHIPSAQIRAGINSECLIGAQFSYQDVCGMLGIAIDMLASRRHNQQAAAFFKKKLEEKTI